MKQVKIFSWLAGAIVCSLLLAAGCAPPAEEAAKPEVGLEKQIPKPAIPEVEPEKQIPALVPSAVEGVTLALKFTPQDSTTYRVITEAQRSIKWEGPVPDEADFKSGRRHNRIEMTFTQQIQSTDDKGNAVAKITIEGLKYYSVIKDKVALDFDSSSIKNPDYPLALLIGQSYTIEIAPTGEVTEVIDVEEARVAVRRGSSVPKRAIALLRESAIKERHRLTALPVTGKKQLCAGDNWSSTKTFSFGRMGSKSYEKIYTLKEIKDRGDRRLAIVEMNAIPTSEMAEQLYKQRETADFSEGFDSTGAYTGRLKLDLTTGKVKEYIENLQSEWIVALPTVAQQDDEDPVVLRMSDTRLYSLEKID